MDFSILVYHSVWNHAYFSIFSSLSGLIDWTTAYLSLRTGGENGLTILADKVRVWYEYGSGIRGFCRVAAYLNTDVSFSYYLLSHAYSPLKMYALTDFQVRQEVANWALHFLPAWHNRRLCYCQCHNSSGSRCSCGWIRIWGVILLVSCSYFTSCQACISPW